MTYSAVCVVSHISVTEVECPIRIRTTSDLDWPNMIFLHGVL